MTNDDLLAALQQLITALRELEDDASANNDSASAAALLSALSNLQNALTIVAARDIIAALPSSDDGTQIKNAMAQIAKATQDIQNEVKSINASVDIARNVATLVLQVSGGQIGAALTTVQHLATLS